jgi:predicted permease
MEVRQVLRSLARNPSFALVAIVMIALGVGGNALIFGAIRDVVLTPAHFHDADRLAFASQEYKGDRWAWSYPQVVTATEATTFEAAGRARFSMTMTREGRNPVTLALECVTANFFPLMGVRFSLGRGLRPDEVTPSGAPVVVMSHAVWERHFGRDPGVIGQTIVLNRVHMTVIGVAEEGFDGTPGYRDPTAEAWIPLTMSPIGIPVKRAADQILAAPGATWLSLIVKLHPGVSIDQAQEELNAMLTRFADERLEPKARYGTFYEIRPIHIALMNPLLLNALSVLQSAAAVVLVLVCVNLAIMLLARASSRNREVAVRMALGAPHGRILGLFLFESLALSLAGGALGMALLPLGRRVLARLQPVDPTNLFGQINLGGARIDTEVMWFGLGVSILTAFAFGLLPALRMVQLGSATLLGGGRGSSSLLGLRQMRPWKGHSLLVSTQVALAASLAAMAALLVGSFVRVLLADPGFRPDNLVTARINLPGQMSKSARLALISGVRDTLAADPAIKSAGVASCLPVSQSCAGIGIQVAGADSDRPMPVVANVVSEEYLGSMGIPLLRGRDFTHRDNGTSPQVAILDASSARRLFGDLEPIGRMVSFDGFLRDSGDFEVVGVAGAVQHSGFGQPVAPAAYLAHRQVPSARYYVAARTVGEAETAVPFVREVIGGIAHGVTSTEVLSMEQRLRAAVSELRFKALLLGMLGILGTALACLGAYSVTSYVLVRTSREIAIRKVLGATDSDISRRTLRLGLGMAGFGTACGVALSLALATVFSAAFREVDGLGIEVFVGLGTVAVVVVVAAYVPSRLTRRVDPARLLQIE